MLWSDPDTWNGTVPVAGDNVTIEVHLINPVAMDTGLRFAIREGGRTVGAGQVTTVIE